MFKRVGVLLLKDRLVLFMSEIQKWFILPSSHVTAYGQALCELTLCGIECNSTKVYKCLGLWVIFYCTWLSASLSVSLAAKCFSI